MRKLLNRIFLEGLVQIPEGWVLQGPSCEIADSFRLVCSSDSECIITTGVWVVHNGSRDVQGHVSGISATISVPVILINYFKSLIKTPKRIGASIHDPHAPISEIKGAVEKLLKKAVKAVDSYMVEYGKRKRERDKQENSWGNRLNSLGKVPDGVEVTESGDLLKLSIFVTDSVAKKIFSFLHEEASSHG